MAMITFMGPIGLPPLYADVTTVQELSVLLKEIKEMEEWIDTCAIAINDTLVSSKETPIEDNDTVVILPPVCGG